MTYNIDLYNTIAHEIGHLFGLAHYQKLATWNSAVDKEDPNNFMSEKNTNPCDIIRAYQADIIHNESQY